MDVQRGARLLRTNGPPALTAEMQRLFELGLESGQRIERTLRSCEIKFWSIFPILCHTIYTPASNASRKRP